MNVTFIQRQRNDHFPFVFVKKIKTSLFVYTTLWG
jgi:hypothetical protein